MCVRRIYDAQQALLAHARGKEAFRTPDGAGGGARWGVVDSLLGAGPTCRDGLLELGILRARSPSSYDVPDLYLAGLNLTRRGGVAKG